MSEKKKEKGKRKIVKQTLKMMRHLVPWLFPVIIVTKMLAAAEPFIHIFLGSVILDRIIQGRPMQEIMELVVLMVVSGMLVTSLHWGLEKIVNVGRRIVDDKLDMMLFEKSMTLDYEILEKKETLEKEHKGRESKRTGRGLDSLCEDLGRLIQYAVEIIYALVILVPLFVPVAGSWSGMAYVLNQWYSFIFLALAAVLVLLSKFYSKRRESILQKEQLEGNIDFNRKFNVYYKFLYEYAIGKDIRLYKVQDMIRDEMRDVNRQSYQISREFVRKQHKYQFMSAAGTLAIQIVSYVYVGLKAIAGLVSIGNVMRYVTVVQRLVDGITNVMDTYIRVEATCWYMAYFNEFMEIKNEKYDGTLPVEKRDDNEYEIEFRDVSFHYPNSEEMVLDHVSSKIHIGQKMAVVGPNGAGKTTFIKLLCRLYDPTEGEILLNGIDIRLYDYKEYMDLFSVVFQDFQLFSFTIAENVAASVNYREKKVEKCLVQAGFGGRLAEIPEGIRASIYQEQEKGIEISGGEAQKIAIARALYKDSPFVVLDEPTAALDPVSEYDIYKRFDEMVRDKTSIYISHRMSSCRFCDNITVFDGGRIVQTGSHEALLADRENLYYKLWTAQAKYYEKAEGTVIT